MSPETRKNQTKNVFEPIRDRQDIERIREHLKDQPRDLLLFDLAVETGAGMKRLLALKIRDLEDVPRDGKIKTLENTSTRSGCVMNAVIHETFQAYLKKNSPNPDDYLFKSKKGNRPLNLSSVSNMIKGWFSAVGIKGSFGAISLRKTWEYHYGKTFHAGKKDAESGLSAIFAPIQTPSAQKLVYNKLISAIISGKIPPGTRLTTSEISKSFNVSHAPVRVALNWLEAKGFIEAQKKKGSTVKELSIQELHEIIKVRIILETAAAKIACKVRSEETLKTLSAIIKRYKNTQSFEEADQLNREFHVMLYRDIDMPLMVRLITDLYDRFSPYAAISYSTTGYIPEHGGDKLSITHYHDKILEGLRNKNTKEVLKNLQTKIDRATLITEGILKERKRRRQEDG